MSRYGQAGGHQSAAAVWAPLDLLAAQTHSGCCGHNPWPDAPIGEREILRLSGLHGVDLVIRVPQR